MRIKQMPQPILTVRGDFGDGLDELVADKFAPIARHAHHPVLAVRIELDRHLDPAVEEPIAAKANIDLNGTAVLLATELELLRDVLVSLLGVWPGCGVTGWGRRCRTR